MIPVSGLPQLPDRHSFCNIQPDWLLTVQARAQHCHLTHLQGAMQHQTMPMVYSEPGFSDQQRAHISKTMRQECIINKVVLKELEKSIQVCALAQSVQRPTTTSVLITSSFMFSHPPQLKSNHVWSTNYNSSRQLFGSLSLRALARCCLSEACATGHTTLLLFRSVVSQHDYTCAWAAGSCVWHAMQCNEFSAGPAMQPCLAHLQQPICCRVACSAAVRQPDTAFPGSCLWHIDVYVSVFQLSANRQSCIHTTSPC